MTHPGRPPARHRHRQPGPPSNPRTGEKEQAEITDPYDLPYPEDHWPSGRPAYLIVVDQPPPWPSSWKPGPAEPANPNPTWKPNHDPEPEATAMALTTNDATMTSDQTTHTAQHTPAHDGWEVSWLPDRTLDRNTAITVMILADLAGAALALASAPPPEKSAGKEPAASPLDREATSP